jgi:hypothetical protein
MTKDLVSTPQEIEGTDFIIDEEFKDWLPPLFPEDIKELEDNILEGGCISPLLVGVMADGKRILVDGHHRYTFCKQHNIPFKIVEKPFDDREQALNWMTAHQKGRRNMSIFQWAEHVLKRKATIAALAKKNQSAGGGSVHLKSDKPLNARKELAKIIGTSHDTLYKIEFILSHLLPTNPSIPPYPNNEKLLIMLRKGDAGGGISIHSVYEELQEHFGKRGKLKPFPQKKSDDIHIPLPHPQELTDQLDGALVYLDAIAKTFPDLKNRDYIIFRVEEWLADRTKQFNKPKDGISIRDCTITTARLDDGNSISPGDEQASESITPAIPYDDKS